MELLVRKTGNTDTPVCMYLQFLYIHAHVHNIIATIQATTVRDKYYCD